MRAFSVSKKNRATHMPLQWLTGVHCHFGSGSLKGGYHLMKNSSGQKIYKSLPVLGAAPPRWRSACVLMDGRSRQIPHCMSENYFCASVNSTAILAVVSLKGGPHLLEKISGRGVAWVLASRCRSLLALRFSVLERVLLTAIVAVSS